ncbi:uncharacterized protein LOC135118237 [Helicoverpa armigera]|uniref:FP protein C-terminal domain-containing protein n=1 Tax=Helicoverpa armigera TaxID=29058 RepID=A0A2W1B2Q3_HELAM|nr:uncharacterized protein LOC110375611 [Helicoverpa armigera]XP_021199345.1 uncharacterized protein LOC110382960 [Helicoverpa armigera]XP_049705015.1 uncharacterized protein LOC126056372 [Helicoverpa armigera]PZC71002.1 hypothetical protein B5X24_HaOG214446 [Helicoverpa armigera]
MSKRTSSNKPREMHYDSDPEVNSAITPLSPLQNLSNITQRFKRKYQQDDDISDLLGEIRKLMSDFTDNQDKKYKALMSAVNDIKNQNTEIQKTTQFLSDKYDELLLKMNQLEKENKEKLAYIQILEEKIENLETFYKSSSLEIRNLPLDKSESKINLCETLINTGKVLNVPLQKSEIRDIYRLKSKSGKSSGTIVVDLSSVIAKDNLLQAFKMYNKKNAANKLSSKDILLDGPIQPIYMSENLTAKKRRLFYLAREKAKTLEYTYCWVSHGRIFLRKKEGIPAIRIDSEKDLGKLQLNKE